MTPSEIETALAVLRALDLRAIAKRNGKPASGTWHRAQQIAVRRAIGLIEDERHVATSAEVGGA